MTAMDNLLFITWNPDLFAFHLGSFGVRWYSLCWCFALLAAYVLVQRLYRQQHIADKLFDPLFFYCFVGILVGARLGHCLFYEPGYFLAHPLEMILPMRQTANGWVFTGYAGLASHGGTIGLMLALWLYVRKTKHPQKVGTGFYFGFCLTTIFTARFFIEYTKEVQEAWEAAMPINMGQILSIPFILLGAYCMAGGKLCRKLGEPR